MRHGLDIKKKNSTGKASKSSSALVQVKADPKSALNGDNCTEKNTENRELLFLVGS